MPSSGGLWLAGAALDPARDLGLGRIAGVKGATGVV